MIKFAYGASFADTINPNSSREITNEASYSKKSETLVAKFAQTASQANEYKTGFDVT